METPSMPSAVWIALATLHKEKPDRTAFFAREIIARIKELNIQGSATEATIKTHVSTHCVANKPPNPDIHRKIVRLAQGMYRLYVDGDYYEMNRKNGQTVPQPDMIPQRFHHLIDWYYNDYVKSNLVRITASGESVDFRSMISTQYENRPVEFTSIDSNNIVRIPDSMMKGLGLKAGDHLGFILDGDKIIVKKAKATLTL